MKTQNPHTSSQARLSKQERKQYIEKLEKEISNWAYQDQLKLEFSKRYVNNLHLFKAEDGDRIQIGPVDRKILEYFIFTILFEYERSFLES